MSKVERYIWEKDNITVVNAKKGFSMDILKSLFGTEKIEEILNQKAKNKQDRSSSMQEPSLVVMTQEECQALCKEAGVKYLTGYESRVLEYAITDETVDRYGDIVRAKGVDFTDYKKNPVINFAHDNSALPVGNTIKIWHDDANHCVKAWGLFVDDRVDKTGFADTVFQFASNKIMRACSIGFLPLEVNTALSMDEKKSMGMPAYGTEFLKSSLLEWSPVSVPANPNATMSNSYKGITKKSLEIAKSFKLTSDEIIKKIEDEIKAMEPVIKIDDTTQAISSNIIIGAPPVNFTGILPMEWPWYKTGTGTGFSIKMPDATTDKIDEMMAKMDVLIDMLSNMGKKMESSYDLLNKGIDKIVEAYLTGKALNLDDSPYKGLLDDLQLTNKTLKGV